MNFSEKVINELIKQVESKLKKYNANNVSIWLGELSDNDLRRLRQHFTKVSREPFGYFNFRLEKPLQ